MTTHEDKIQDSKGQMVENDFSSQQRIDPYSSQFVDNRPEAVVQQRVGEMAMNSPQIQRMTGFQQMANKHAVLQRHPIQSKASPELSRRENSTGMPDNLKSGIENLSGIDVSDVRVHYNSAKPAQMNAHAYAQGSNIHIASGQEKHLAHEAWHTVQQKQGRVKPTTRVNGIAVNDNKGLEKEADVMGGKAFQMKEKPKENKSRSIANSDIQWQGGVSPISRIRKTTNNAGDTTESKAYGDLHRYPLGSFSHEPSTLIQGNNINGSVAQRARTRVLRANAPPWTWTTNLDCTWQTHDVPIHPCFRQHVGRNQLVGGWTVIDSTGTTGRSNTYGAYNPGVGKVNHVERKFFRAMQDDLETEMADDTTYDDNALGVVEINQWNTPCSGAQGCTTFLDNKIVELNTLYNEVSAAGRFRAQELYESSVSEAYYKHPKLRRDDLEEEDGDTPMNIVGGEIVHEKLKSLY